MIRQLLNSLGMLQQDQAQFQHRIRKISAQAWEITRELLVNKMLSEGAVGIVVQGKKFSVVDGSQFESEDAFLSEVQEHLADGEGANFVILAQTGYLGVGAAEPTPIVSVVVKTPVETFTQFAPVGETSDGYVMIGEIQTAPGDVISPYSGLEKIRWSLQ